MASVTSVTATPSTVAPGGGQSHIVPVITNTGSSATVTVQVDGSSGSAIINLAETLTFTTDITKIGVKGFVVGSVSAGGVLAVAPDGVSFTFTAT